MEPLGTFSYNGVILGYSAHTLQYRVEPVYTSDGRTLKYNRWSITMQVYLDGQPTDTKVVQARQNLLKPGGRLYIIDRGLGDITVNVTRARDALWGPKPKEMSFEYIGSENCCKMIWSVEFHMADCPDARYQFAPLEYVTEISWSIDVSGLTRRSVNGSISIPLTRRSVNDASLTDSADNYRERIFPPFIPGFRRIPGEFTLSPDRTTLKFSYVDEELETFFAPPPGITSVDLSHSISGGSTAKGNVTTYKWLNVISGSYTSRKGANKLHACIHFLQVAKDRTTRITNSRAAGEFKSVFVQPLGFQFVNNYYSQKQQFTFTYLVVGAHIGYMLKDGGFYDDVPVSDWVKWAESMKEAHGSRGTAQLKYDPSSDEVLDLCSYPKRAKRSNEKPRPTFDLRGLVAEGIVPLPKENNSWLDWNCSIKIEDDPGYTEMRTLPTQLLTPVEDVNNNVLQTHPMLRRSPPGKLINDMVVPQKEDKAELRQQPIVYLTIEGSAIRANFPIVRPRLRNIDGVEVTPANRIDKGEGFIMKSLGVLGWPLYGARWKLRYSLSELPENIRLEDIMPLNPMHGHITPGNLESKEDPIKLLHKKFGVKRKI